MLVSIEPREEEAALVRAARDGDRVAFGALYEKYARMVHGIVLAHARYADAEDLMQNVFLRAMEELSALREPAAFGGWLGAIARRVATDHARAGRRFVTHMPEIAAAARPDNESFAILDALRTLPPSYRETLALRLVEGMTGPEIAAQTGLTPESVRVNLCRGMRMFRALLEGGSR